MVYRCMKFMGLRDLREFYSARILYVNNLLQIEKRPNISLCFLHIKIINLFGLSSINKFKMEYTFFIHKRQNFA